jgi:hypothetical protein
VDHPAFSNGITAEEWDRDWSYEDRENYLSGMYDQPCPGDGIYPCENGKVRLPVKGRLSFGELRELLMRRYSWEGREEMRHEMEREARMLGEY